MSETKYSNRAIRSRMMRLKVSIGTLSFLSGESEETLRHLRDNGGAAPSRLAAILSLLAAAGPERRAYMERLAADDRSGDRIEWRPIPWFPDYNASSVGSIRRVAGTARGWLDRELKQKLRPTGHMSVTVAAPDGRQVSIGVHRLVALAFLGDPPAGKPMALHKNGIANDNRPSNLYWGDHAENTADRLRHDIERAKLTQKRHMKHPTVIFRGQEKRILTPPQDVGPPKKRGRARGTAQV